MNIASVPSPFGTNIQLRNEFHLQLNSWILKWTRMQNHGIFLGDQLEAGAPGKAQEPLCSASLTTFYEWATHPGIHLT